MKFVNLVLGPGGSNGYYQIGSLIKLIEIHVIDDLKFLRGCSVGAIIGFLHILGCCPAQIMKYSFEIKSIFTLNNFDLESSLKNGGLFDVIDIIKIIDGISAICGYINPTFKQLYTGTGIEFSVMATSARTAQCNSIEFNYRTHPDYLVLEAIKHSIFIPGIFFDSTKSYDQIEYIDGAFSCPLPIHDLPPGNTLAIFIDKNLPSSQIGFVIYSHEIPLIRLRQQSIMEEIANDELFLLGLRTDNSDVIGVTNDGTSRTKMLIAGYLQTRQWFLKEKISKHKKE